MALVIGNAGYGPEIGGPLPHAAADAADMASTLRSVGFESVLLATDCSREDMVETISKFYASQGPRYDFSYFYYSGHAVQVPGGDNMLVPIDCLPEGFDLHAPPPSLMAPPDGAQLPAASAPSLDCAHARHNFISTQWITRLACDIPHPPGDSTGLGNAEGGGDEEGVARPGAATAANSSLSNTPAGGARRDLRHQASVMVLDACRDARFPESSELRDMVRRNPGLCALSPVNGFLTEFSASPGRIAAEGSGRNSVYAKHLMSAIESNKGVRAQEVFDHARLAVWEDPQAGRQQPWESATGTAALSFH